MANQREPDARIHDRSVGRLGAIAATPNDRAPSPVSSSRRHVLERWLTGGSILVALLAAVQLLNLCRLHAVNVLFWDHWGYYSNVLNPSMSLWDLFSMQHGPHRGGAGYVLCRLLLPWTHADVRVDGFVVILLVMFCSLLALALRRRLTGELRWHDASLVLLFLAPSAATMMADTPNPTHGVLPLLFVLLSALAWTIQSRLPRYLCVVPLNFAAIFTGFGFFWGLVTPLLLGYDLCIAARRRDWRGVWIAGLILLLAIGTLAMFFHGYHWPTGSSAGPAATDPLRYLAFVSLAWARAAGIVGTGAIALGLGGLLAIAFGVVLVYCTAKLARQPGHCQQQWLVPAALILFSLLFAAAMSRGRAQLDIAAAQAPRYVPLMLPGLVGLYFWILNLRRTRLRAVFLSVFLVAGGWAGLHLDSADAAEMSRYSSGKRRWVAAYLQTRDVAAADRLSGFEVSQNKRRLPERLRELERRQLSLFALGQHVPTAATEVPPSIHNAAE